MSETDSQGIHCLLFSLLNDNDSSLPSSYVMSLDISLSSE
jgi:hypothetical protein